MIKKYVRHWYRMNMILFLMVGVVLIWNWNAVTTIQRLIVCNLMALMVHQFEEYGCPGGEPMIMNKVLQKSDIPDRYPLNQFSAMFTNDFAILLYAFPLLFPETMWIVLVPMLFDIGQFVVHGIVTNRAMKTYYNPGLGAVVLLHLPISIYFFWYASQHHLLSGMDWVLGIPLTLLSAGVFIGFMTYVLFASRKTKWVFATEELKKFHVKENIETANTFNDTKVTGPFLMAQTLQKKLHPNDHE